MRILLAGLLSILIIQHVSHAGVINQSVRTINKTGSTPLSGAVTITQGTGITITQLGQDIAISATSSSGSSGTPFTEFQMSGGVTVGNMGPPDQAEVARTVSLVSCTMRNSGSAGSTLVKLSYGSGASITTTSASFVNVTITANDGIQYGELVTPGIVQAQHDYIDMEVTTPAFGAPDDLRCKILY